MGYDLSWEQGEKLERYRREGRLCAVSTGRGGCFNRATVRQTQESWYYEGDKLEGKPPRAVEMTLCVRHARQYPAGYEGVNFRVVAQERF